MLNFFRILLLNILPNIINQMFSNKENHDETKIGMLKSMLFDRMMIIS